MPGQPLPAPIRILPAQLADQIAAGEVIERPASVLKELLENALDAQADRIDVELLQGGMDAIRVTDNGHGISGDELPLAIARHATSKIARLDDLLELASLGFRGEALASICSVSQWEIASRQAGQARAYRMHYSNPLQVSECHHETGTSIQIRKIFHNTPARRKFLRAERTELRHCDDVFRRMALARFDTGFYFRHNGRQIHRLPAVRESGDRSRRVSQLCGEAFLNSSLFIDFPRDDMRLWGWISRPEYSRQQTDLQYFYINGRIIRDRVINHALRLAYNNILAPGRHAAYVLHLELDPASVDVNVHPTKHEVRFREARRIHDFIIRSLRDGLQQGEALSPGQQARAVAETPMVYAAHTSAPAYPHDAELAGEESVFGNLLVMLLQRFALTQSAQHLYLIDVWHAQVLMNLQHWRDAFNENRVKQRPLLIPERLALDGKQAGYFGQQAQEFARLGFDIDLAGPRELLLRAIPIWLMGFDSRQLLHSMLDDVQSAESRFEFMNRQLLSQTCDISGIDFRRWLQELSRQRDSLRACWRRVSSADLTQLLQTPASHD